MVCNTAIFLNLTGNFGPGGGAVHLEQSNAGHYYNRTKQGPGVITADQLPVVNAIQQTNKQGTLTIRLQHPYNEFTEVKGIIRVVDNNGTQVPSENTTDGSVNFPLLYDRKYSIAVPQNITLVTNMVRANFLNWSDGQKSVPEIINIYHHPTTWIERDLTLHNNVELFVLYNTQYHLVVNPSFLSLWDKTNGTGWYDSSSQASFYAPPRLTSSIWIEKFDHWEGDIYSAQQITQPSGFLTMDGPKTITAKYALDFKTPAIIAEVGGVAVVIDLILRHRIKKRVN